MYTYTKDATGFVYREKQNNLKLQLKEVSTKGVFSGYAAVYDVVDLGGDMLHRGSFGKNLKDKGNKRKLLWQHDKSTPIGVVELSEDNTGLKIDKGKFNLNSQEGKNAYENTKFWLEEDLTAELSIGWRSVKSPTWDEDGVAHIKEAKVFEVSVVSIAMNPLAQVTELKELSPYQKLPIDKSKSLPEYRTWSETIEVAGLIAEYQNKSSVLRKAFLLQTGEKEFALPIAGVRDGVLHIIPEAVYNAAGIVWSEEFVKEYDPEVVDGVRLVLEKYLSRLGKVAPWVVQSTCEKYFEIVNMILEVNPSYPEKAVIQKHYFGEGKTKKVESSNRLSTLLSSLNSEVSKLKGNI